MLQSRRPDCAICRVLMDPPPQEVVVREGQYWRIALADDQAYLGRAYVTLRQHCSSLSDLTPRAWEALHQEIKWYEQRVKQVFGARVVNWNCLMNNAFQVEPAYPHVHWHARPRYDQPVTVGSVTYEDAEFAHHYSRQRQEVATPVQLAEIGRRLSTL